MTDDTVTHSLIDGIKGLLDEMKERKDDISIARVTIFMHSGHRIENIIYATSANYALVVQTDEGCCIKCHHVKPDEIAGYSHVQFN